MNKEELNKLAARYGMKGSHFHADNRGFIIVTRQGIEHIQHQLNIDVRLEAFLPWSSPEEGRYVVQCFARRPMPYGGELTVQTFGEVSKTNNRNAYPVAMAEKRALSRAVLKLAGLYKEGVYGEDEMETQTADK
jgi:hypothetical protein